MIKKRWTRKKAINACPQMHTAMNEASTRLLTQLFMFNMADPAAMSQFLELHVTRENIVQDTIRELSNYNERDFKKPLKVSLLLCGSIWIRYLINRTWIRSSLMVENLNQVCTG
jgi:hypothetical protein